MNTSLNKAVLVAVLVAVFLGQILGAAAGEGKPEVTGKNRKMVYYTVREGDNLSLIAEKTGVTLSSLIRTNRLSSTVIYPKQVLVIPGNTPDFGMALSRGFSRDEIMLLARAIYAEARGESFTGQVAVGAVILNRVENREFPKTISEVIMQNQSGTFQFTPVEDGSINLEPDEIAICAAIKAISGHDPTGGALFFYNPETASDQWIRTLPVISRIGNHVFASKS